MTNTVQPTRSVKLKHLIAGSIALLAILAVMGIPILYGLRKVGLIHVGGVVESVASDRDAYDPANPLTIRVAVEKNRGRDRYAKVEIRARAFVEDGGARTQVAEFRQIPQGRTHSNLVQSWPGTVVPLEATALDEDALNAMRRAGEIVVVVDEYEAGNCVDDAVGEFTVRANFSLFDKLGSVFASEPVSSRR